MSNEKISMSLKNEIDNHEISMSEISKRLREYAKDTKNKAMHANKFAELLRKNKNQTSITEGE